MLDGRTKALEITGTHLPIRGEFLAGEPGMTTRKKNSRKNKMTLGGVQESMLGPLNRCHRQVGEVGAKKQREIPNPSEALPTPLKLENH